MNKRNFAIFGLLSSILINYSFFNKTALNQKEEEKKQCKKLKRRLSIMRDWIEIDERLTVIEKELKIKE